MDRDELAARIADACILHGSFTLRSGATSPTYFDKYQLEADPDLLTEVCVRLEPLVPAGTEVLAGLELGGVPLATRLSSRTGLPACFVRKEPKRYGTMRLAEGVPVDGRTVLIVEDVVSTGGQIARSAGDLRAIGAEITHAMCVVDRSGGAHPALDQVGLALLSAFTAADLPGLQDVAG